MFGQQNIDNLNLEPFQFCQEHDYSGGSNIDDETNISSNNTVYKDKFFTSFDKLQEKNEDVLNFMQLTDNGTAVLNDQTDKPPSTIFNR